MLYKCLIIDDNSMKDDSESYANDAKKKGIQLEFLEEFGIGRSDRDDLLDENNNLDGKKIIEAFESEYSNERIDLFAIDFDFEDEAEKFTGLEAARIVRSRNKRAQIIIYSANLDKVATKIMEDFDPEDTQSTLDRIKTLFSAKITAIVKRENLGSSIATQIEKKTPSLDDLILEGLEQLPKIPFKQDFISIKDKIVAAEDLYPDDLINEIQSGSNLSAEVMRELIARTLSFWIDYNAD